MKTLGWIAALAVTASGCVMEMDADELEVASDEIVLGVTGAFAPAAQGCAMAHCDPQMTDHVDLSIPTSSRTQVLWHDTDSLGSQIGLGCVSNGRRVACTYRNPVYDNLVVYDAYGNVQWTSGARLGPSALGSAALIDEDGGVIAVDAYRTVRYDPNGQVLWDRLHTYGMPISPVITGNNILVLAKKGGPLSTVSPYTGAELRVLAGYDGWETINTPAVRGDRVYVSAQNANDDAILLAADIDAIGRITPRWAFPFQAPAGASPLVIGDRIYFDGMRCARRDASGACTLATPWLFGLRDRGTRYERLFTRAMVTPATASFSRDPDGGFWMYEYGRPLLFRRDETSGAVIETIDVNALMADPENTYIPASAMSIALSARHGPVLVVNGSPSLVPISATPSSILAIALRSHARLWSVTLHSVGRIGDNTAAQYPIVLDALGRPVVVAAGWYSGAYGIGVP